jgi:DNA polymerase-3 subunit gamma/tau
MFGRTIIFIYGGLRLYKALYRKWRPSVFEDVVGQPNITATLKNEVIAGRIAHAYLFTGSRGTGKTTCAKILAKAVNCLNPQNGNPCNECEICRGIDDGSILDVSEIDAASNNKVDDARVLREEIVFRPAAAKYRVYIIDEAHMLTNQAFNALLKTLEEPPSYVIFILATTEVHKIPATIISRCQRFDFQRIPLDDIAARVTFVAQQEKIEIDPEAAQMIARVSDGGLRDALSLLDQCAGSGHVSEDTVALAAGLTSRDYLFKLSDAVKKRDSASAMRIIDELYSSSKNIERLCEELISHFRDIMVVKTVENPFDLINCRSDEREKLQNTAKDFPIESILHALDTLQASLGDLKYSASGRVGMETCLLRLCNPELDTTNAALARRIKILEDKLASGSFAAAPARQSAAVEPQLNLGAEQAAQAEKTETENKSAAAEKRKALAVDKPKPEIPREQETPAIPNTEKQLDCWADVLEELKNTDRPLFGVLKDSNAVISGNFVLIEPNNALFAGLIKSKDHQSPIIEAIRKITGTPYRVGIYKKDLKKAPKKDDAPADGLDEIFNNAEKAGIDIHEQ